MLPCIPVTRAWFLVAILACRERAAPRPADPVAAPAPPPPATKLPRPELPAPAADAALLVTAAEVFAAEPVDTTWKSRTEHEIRKRLVHLPHPPTDLECRHSQCKLTFVGDNQELVQVMDELERERALNGLARSVLWTGAEPRPDGKLTMHAYASFDRPEPEP